MSRIRIVYTFLLSIGAFQLPNFIQSSDPVTDDILYQNLPGSYLVSHVSKFYEPDPVTGELVSYELVSIDDGPSRVKRQIISSSSPEDDKSAFTKDINKKLPNTKKPTLFLTKETNVVNNVSTSTTSVSTSKVFINKTEPTIPTLTPTTTSNYDILTNTTFKVTTMKALVVDVVTKVSPTMNSFPGFKINTSDSNNTSTNTTIDTTTTSNSTSISPDYYPPFPDFPSDFAKNYTIKNDTHRYYNSSYFQNGEFLWIDLDSHPYAETHDLLSNAHRRAATVKLEFDFPFYGHLVRNVTMATGGFIYLGETVHAWLAATQYVAPLMANFHSKEDIATVRYLSNGSQFTVEWNQVHLHNNTDQQPFTFQTTLFKNGTIVFAYKEIPAEVKALNDTHHPVKVGLSDAYITDKTILFVKSRTIFEYDRVDLRDYQITNGSGIIFTALPTCLSYTNCQDCTNHDTQFHCVWCPNAVRCSDGTDRHRQDWIVKSCTFQSLDSQIACYIGTTSTENSDTYRNFAHDDHHQIGDDDHDHNDNKHLITPGDEQYNHDHPQTIYTPEKVTRETPVSSGMSASGIMALMIFFMILLGTGGWILYAYNYPHSPSGQLLIRFRPSQWGAFRRGEARYTAASIHM